MNYHLSDVANRASIEKHGLRPNENDEIFTIVDMLVANKIAATQIFAKEYDVWAIDPRWLQEQVEDGNIDIYDDKVAEFSASLHEVLVCDENIPPKAIHRIASRKATAFDAFDCLTHWMHFGVRHSDPEEIAKWYQKMYEMAESNKEANAEAA